jgi:endonuclease YncB( thermonuclease family)
MKRDHTARLAAFASALAALAISSTASAAPREISGSAHVIDGDSLRVGGAEVRLFGIDAFEGRQTCERGGSRWNCGEAAADRLRALVGSRAISCEQKDIDSYGRTVAVCRSGAVDVGAELVRSGLALAYRRYSSDYVDEENEARSARRGAWAGTFTPPWDERRQGTEQRSSQSAGGNQPAPTSSCRGTGIKGNINGKGEHIYHVPGSSSYDATVIDESKGERWFCPEDDARRSGWRAPRTER